MSMNEGRRMRRGIVGPPASSQPAQCALRALAAAFGFIMLLACPLQPAAQQRTDQYAGYSPSSKTADADSKSLAKKKSAKKSAKKSTKKRRAERKVEAKTKSARDAATTTSSRTTAIRKATAGAQAKLRPSKAAGKSLRADSIKRSIDARKRSASKSREAVGASATKRDGAARPPDGDKARIPSSLQFATADKPARPAPSTSEVRSADRPAAPASRPAMSAERPAAPLAAAPAQRPLLSYPGSNGARRAGQSIHAGQSTFATWVGVPMLAGALGAFLYFRRRPDEDEQESLPHIDPTFDASSADVALTSQQVKAELMQRAEPFFVDLRNASVRQDHEFILQHCTEDMATSLILDSAVTNLPAESRVEGLRAELVDLFEEVNRYVASVQYTADEQLGDRRPRRVNEVWHFVREPEASDWRLAAVEAT